MKKKVIFLFLLIVFFFFLLITSSFASTKEVIYNNQTYTLPNIDVFDNPNAHYIITYYNNKFMLYYTTDVDFWRFVVTSNKVDAKKSSSVSCSVRKLAETNTAVTTWATNKNWGDLSPFNLHTIIDSTDDIYNSDGTIYYQGSLLNRFGNVHYTNNDDFYRISSDNIPISFLGDLSFQVSYNSGDYVDFNIDTIGNSFWFYYDAYYNGNYTIKIKVLSTNEEKVIDFNVVDLIDKPEIEFILSNYENTTEPIYIISNKYYYTGEYNAEEDFLNNYYIDISYGYDMPYDYAPLSVDVYDEDEHRNYRQYQFKVVVNGIYNLRILNLNTGDITYKSFNVKNIGVKNKYGDDIYYDNYNSNGVFEPSPVLFLEYLSVNSVRIRTQPFTFNELISLQCFTSSNGEDYTENSNIYSYTISTNNTMYDATTKEKRDIIELYYFYLDVQFDGTYYFKFYNLETKTNKISSIDVDIYEFVMSNVNNIDNFTEKVALWSRSHFGVLTYPSELFARIVTSIININFDEPVINIPELRDPVNNYKILDPISYNFNSMLENNVFAFIHNLYMGAVSFIIIVLFCKLCWATFNNVVR